MNQPKKENNLYLYLSYAALVIIFIIDCFVRLGDYGGIPYVIGPVVLMWLLKPDDVLWFSATSAVFTVLAFLLGEDHTLLSGLINRFMAIFAIVGIAMLIKRHTDDEDKFVDERRHLKSVIDKRTEGLKQVVDQLDETKIRLSEAEELGYFGFWEYYPDNHEMIWSNGVFAIYGMPITPQAPSIHEFMDQCHTEDVEALQRSIQYGISQKRSYTVEYRVIMPDGSIKWIYNRGRPIANRRGEVEVVVGTIQDITVRKLDQESVQSNRARYTTLFKNAGVGKVLMIPNKRILEVNHAFVNWVGYSEKQLLKVPLEKLMHKDDRNRDSSYAREMISGESEFFQAEKRFVRKDGTILWGLFSVSPVFESEDRIACFAVEIVDITRHKNMEMALSKAQDAWHEAEEMLTESDANLRVTKGELQENSQALVNAQDEIQQLQAQLEQLKASGAPAPVATNYQQPEAPQYQEPPPLQQPAQQPSVQSSKQTSQQFSQQPASDPIPSFTDSVDDYYEEEITTPTQDDPAFSPPLETPSVEAHIAPMAGMDLEGDSSFAGEFIEEAQLATNEPGANEETAWNEEHAPQYETPIETPTQPPVESSAALPVNGDLSNVFAQTKDMMAILRLDGCYQQVSPALQRELGYGEGDLDNQHMLNFVHPDDRDRIHRHLIDLHGGGRVSRISLRHLSKFDGYIRYLWDATVNEVHEVIFSILRPDIELRGFDEPEYETPAASPAPAVAPSPAPSFNAFTETDAPEPYSNPDISVPEQPSVAEPQEVQYSSEIQYTPEESYEEAPDYAAELTPPADIPATNGVYEQEPPSYPAVEPLPVPEPVVERPVISEPEPVAEAPITPPPPVVEETAPVPEPAFAPEPVEEFVEDRLPLPVSAYVGPLVAPTPDKPAVTVDRNVDWHRLTDRMPFQIWMLGADMGCRYVNRKVRDYTGLPFEQLEGKGWSKAVHPEDYRKYLAYYREAFRNWQPMGCRYRLRRNDGLYRWMQESSVPLIRKDGAVEGYLVTAMDITSLHTNESKFVRAYEGAVNLIDIKSALHPCQKSESLTTFSDSVKVADALIANSREIPNSDLAWLMEHAGLRLQTEIKNILSFANAEPESSRLIKRRITLDSIVDATIEMLAPLRRQDGVRFQINGSNKEVGVLVDKVLGHRIFENLMHSLLQWAESRVITIDIFSHAGKGYAQFRHLGEVLTQGILENLDSIFRDEPQSLYQRKTWLDLALMKRLTHALDGDMHVLFEKGTGPVIQLEFEYEPAPEETQPTQPPVSQSPETAAPAAAEPVAAGPASIGYGQPPVQPPVQPQPVQPQPVQTQPIPPQPLPQTAPSQPNISEPLVKPLSTPEYEEPRPVLEPVSEVKPERKEVYSTETPVQTPSIEPEQKGDGHSNPIDDDSILVAAVKGKPANEPEQVSQLNSVVQAIASLEAPAPSSRKKAPIQPPEDEEILVHEKGTNGKSIARHKVLIGETNSETQRLVRSLLQPYYELTIVPNTSDLLKRAEESQFDLLLFDIHMEGGPSGVDVLRELRRRPQYTRTPAIAVASNTSAIDQRELIDRVGFDGFLRKPYSIVELLETVERMIES